MQADQADGGSHGQMAATASAAARSTIMRRGFQRRLVGVLLCGDRFEVEFESAFRHIHPDRVARRFGLVIRLQLLPQPAGLEPDYGIVFRIVGGGLPEGLEANGVLFQPISLSGNGLLGQVLKQAPVNLRGFERLALDQTATCARMSSASTPIECQC